MPERSTSSEPLKVALIGCGQIADAHLQQIARIRSARVIAVCDLHADLAEQAAARFGIAARYNDPAEMLARERPDVVQIATPAHTHHAVARLCLAADCHVYVEKPFTLTAPEAESLLDLAAERGRLACVGHDQLFDPAWLEVRDRIARGELGEVRHVESTLGYPLSGQFGALVASDPRHWVRRLPGGLFHNTISHPLYRITEFLKDDRPQIDARWRTRPGFNFPTELRVDLQGASVSGTLTFATTIASQRITRIYGTTGTLECELDGQIVRRIGPAPAPGAFAKLLTPWRQRREAARTFRRQLGRFARGKIHYFAGLKSLCERFYDAIRTGAAPPIPPAEIVRVTRIMDEIFETARQRDASTNWGGAERRGSEWKAIARDSRPAAAMRESLT
ncbi:MAG: Gfo/Idh/MocA family oxidoreductase [Planctomyces sp.]|nr:Gfo/Idh/MocA family oxidoreductase [Planctomyces sp.]